MVRNNSKASSAIRLAVIICSSAALSIGVFWLAAWLIGRAITWAAEGAITVKTNMAVSQILSGAALLLGIGHSTPTRRLLGRSAAVIVLLMGAITLSEHVIGWNLHIDQFLISEPPGAAATASPNRVGLPGSTSLLLLGAGLLCLKSRRQAFAPYFGLAVCVINLVPAVGFLFGIEDLYALPKMGTAWPTVLALTLLGGSLILAHSENSFMSLLLREDPGGALLRRLFPAAVLVPLVLGLVRMWGERRGLYDTPTGTGILVITLVLVFSTILWRSAARLSVSASAERQSQEAQQALIEERGKILESERIARSEAERANRLKDEFLANLSHELRTPLNSILGWSHILRRGHPDAESIGKGLEVIERNTRIQVRLISDLLDMSRIISGKMHLKTENCDPVPALEAAIDSVAPAAAAKRIRIERLIEPLRGQILGDPSRLQQAFWNLLSNAIKFTPCGGQVQVATKQTDAAINVVVRDTGKGIKPEFLPHIFERFRQDDSSASKDQAGLGLGLAIVKHLVELHGGTVDAESLGEGHGATFTIMLPITSIAQEADVNAARRSSKELKQSAIALNGVTVLFVDDEQDTRDMVKRLLEGHGAIVIVADTAAKAIDSLQELRPDVLVGDIGMPGEDGYEMIRKIRELPAEAGGHTPAIALTAYSRIEDRTRAIVAGYQYHMTKPVDAAELVSTLVMITQGLTKKAYVGLWD